MAETREHQIARASGLLLHVTSLPGRFAIGDLGPAARWFLSRIGEAGQRYWQVLPVYPAGYGDSPYSASSTFAGNPLLISLEALHEWGLIADDELDSARARPEARVDYDAARGKLPLVRLAARRLTDSGGREQRERLAEFEAREGPAWLDDYCLYASLKDAHDGEPWTRWDQELAQRQPDALAEAARAMGDSVEVNRRIQFLFFDQWQALHSAATEDGVGLVGDLPLYVAHDSADVWANPGLFRLDGRGQPTVVAGVPPDYFSTTGQRWGNPIFDWEQMAESGFAWWRARMRHALSLFDVVRIDHFRGIAGYWEIPAAEPTAVNGEWKPGPGESLLRAFIDELGDLPIVAEDLGVITDDVISLREAFGLPGMRVAQFGFDDAPDTALHHPDNFPENVWAYTGTHDNNTTEGWFWEGNPQHRVWRLKRARRRLYRRVGGRIPWGLVDLVGHSRADKSIFPVQDIIGLGGEARMNTPGTVGGNWEWRLLPGQLTEGHLARLEELTRESGRSP